MFDLQLLKGLLTTVRQIETGNIRKLIKGRRHSHPAHARKTQLGRKTSPCRWEDLDVECPPSDHCFGTFSCEQTVSLDLVAFTKQL